MDKQVAFKVDAEGRVYWAHFQPEMLDEATKKAGDTQFVSLEEFERAQAQAPSPKPRKVAEFKWDKARGFYWEEKDRPPTQEEVFDELSKNIAAFIQKMDAFMNLMEGKG